jgi:hypothetical protein
MNDDKITVARFLGALLFIAAWLLAFIFLATIF